MTASRELSEPGPGTRPIEFSSGAARLHGTIFTPAGRPRVAVVLHGATGVPASYYRSFAEWLSEAEGAVVLTYDYRDFGASKTGPARLSTATMSRWGIEDQASALDEMKRHTKSLPLWVVGHSLGGMMLPFHARTGEVERAIFVASGAVHFSDHPTRYKPQVAAFWYALGPLLTKVLGYLPGRLIGLGSDIPKGVYWQWRNWCTTRGFYVSQIGQQLPIPDWYKMRGRIKFVAVSDDVMCPPASVWRLMKFYPAARRRQLTLRPARYGLTSIGHIGVFSKRSAACWPDILASDTRDQPTTVQIMTD